MSAAPRNHPPGGGTQREFHGSAALRLVGEGDAHQEITTRFVISSPTSVIFSSIRYLR
jgi:hypothetical protein